jgi:hypothetical protein
MPSLVFNRRMPPLAFGHSQCRRTFSTHLSCRTAVDFGRPQMSATPLVRQAEAQMSTAADTSAAQALGPSAGSAAQSTTSLETAPPQPTATSRNLPKASGSRLATSKFASATMASTAATRLSADSSTAALCVGLETILSSPTLRTELFPVVTPLHWQAWEDHLNEAGLLEEFADVPVGIRDGFRLGYNECLISCYMPPNHASAINNPIPVRAYIEKEISAGRYSTGYDPKVLGSKFNFRTSPLGLVDKDGKFRVISDFSFPRNDPSQHSLNSKIDVSWFKTDYATFAECYLFVINAPPGSQAAVYDVDAAYRRMPIAPEDQAFVCLHFDGYVYIDHNTCFGSASSHAMLGRCANSICAIFKFHGVQDVIKWVNDFVFFRYPTNLAMPWSYSYNSRLVDSLADVLGWPWAPKKHSPFAFSFNYLGMTWDLENKMVFFSQKKKERYLAKIAHWDTRSPVTRKEVESIIGTLNHCSLVLVAARTHLPSLYEFARRFNSKSSNPFTTHRITARVTTNIRWWRAQLSADFCGMILRPQPAPLDLRICMDASTSWGIGFWMEGKWVAWRSIPGWKGDGRDIGWLEMVAVELALRTVINAGYNDVHLIFRSDNSGVVGAFKNGSSRNAPQNAILRRIIHLFHEHNIWVSTNWIPTEDNPADGPSRGVFPPFKDLFSPLPKLPAHLSDFLEAPISFRTNRELQLQSHN